MQTISTLTAAGNTDPGLQREVNEDRFHVDVARGLFILVDGIGGQAAGGKAADVALTMLRARLERETGPTADRCGKRSRLPTTRFFASRPRVLNGPGWPACSPWPSVDEQRATIGHVGDTRLYKLRGDGIEKVTRDHSPVGEREDAHEISEVEAMRHRGGTRSIATSARSLHSQTDPEFIDLLEIPFEPDAALLLCSDGLTDLVESADHQPRSSRCWPAGLMTSSTR
jgi:serine/threonine protein phosphatase PrpC